MATVRTGDGCCEADLELKKLWVGTLGYRHRYQSIRASAADRGELVGDRAATCTVQSSSSGWLMASVLFRPLASSQGRRDAARGQRAGSVGPPGFSLASSYRLPGPVPVQSGLHNQWHEELGEFHEPWTQQHGRRDHCGDGFALRCLN